MNAFFYPSKRGINFAKIRGFKVTDYSLIVISGRRWEPNMRCRDAPMRALYRNCAAEVERPKVLCRKCSTESAPPKDARPAVRDSHKNKRGVPGWVGPPQFLLYPEPGSNRHSLNGHWCLRPARLPIPPSGPAVDWSAKVIKISCWQKFYSGYGFFLPQASNTTS